MPEHLSRSQLYRKVVKEKLLTRKLVCEEGSVNDPRKRLTNAFLYKKKVRNHVGL